jgi:hypothetical protein
VPSGASLAGTTGTDCRRFRRANGWSGLCAIYSTNRNFFRRSGYDRYRASTLRNRSGDAVGMFMSQVAAVSCAATQVPESRLTNQKFRKAGLRSAVHVELFVKWGLMMTRAAKCWINSRQNAQSPERTLLLHLKQ